MKIDWNKAKSDIPILKVAHDLGYKKVHDKSSINHVVLENDKGDRIRVKHPNEPRLQIYTNVNEIGTYNLNNNGDYGSVIDFIKNRINQFPQATDKNIFGAINQVLSHYHGITFSYTEFCKEEGYRATKEFDINNYQHKPANINSLFYLSQERGLSQYTLHKFLPFIYLIPKEFKGKQYNNIGFPYTQPTDERNGKTPIKGFEERNFKYKGFSEGGDKLNSVWEANFSDRANTKDVFFFESAIDAMSFYQLYKDKYNFDNSTFISVGGAISDKQIDNVLKVYPQAKIRACFDNDMTGRFFDATLAAAIKGDNLKARIHKDGSVSFCYNDKQFEKIRFEGKPTLADLEKIIGIRLSSKISVVKPKSGKDFNEILTSENQREKKSINLKR